MPDTYTFPTVPLAAVVASFKTPVCIENIDPPRVVFDLHVLVLEGFPKTTLTTRGIVTRALLACVMVLAP